MIKFKNIYLSINIPLTFNLPLDELKEFQERSPHPHDFDEFWSKGSAEMSRYLRQSN
jgi:cephalosporin-C deacetylase-like acetyl esterase